MTNNNPKMTSRREFIKDAGRLAAVSALAGVAIPRVHAAENNTLQVALIGCGGRGTGAAANALSTIKQGPVTLAAMADVFENKLRNSYDNLKKNYTDLVDVPEDKRFIGFDAYEKAMDCLKPGDIAIFATPPAFRAVHFEYAIKKGLNVFMEKPVTVDGPTSKKMLQLADDASAKNLKVGVGLMVRHCKGRKELWQRIRDGQIGEIVSMRAYRMGGRAGMARPKPEGMSELMHQIRSFHAWLWASGGIFSDFFIHQIDECSWMKDAWPIQAHATGGRHYRGDSPDQNFDNYSVEYTYPDGTKFFYYGRSMAGCHDDFSSYALGAKGSAIISTASHTPGKVRIFKGHNITKDSLLWAFPQPEPSPYQLEWDDLVEAIRNNKPYNEVKRGVEASLVTSMGRMAAHTGNVVTFDDMLNCPHEFSPNLDKLTKAGESPLKLGSDGKYPIPQPGILRDREY